MVEVVVEGMVCYISILMHDISITLFNTLQVKFKFLFFCLLRTVIRLYPCLWLCHRVTVM